MHAATRNFSVQLDGGEVTVKEGERFDDDHEIVRCYPQWFKPTGKRSAQEPAVEQATAAPGERRDVKPPSGE